MQLSPGQLNLVCILHIHQQLLYTLPNTRVIKRDESEERGDSTGDLKRQPQQ